MDKNKKIIYSILTAFIIMLLLYIGYAITKNNGGGTGKYNDCTSQFIHEDTSKIMKKLESKKRGIYYFGFPTCPWCQELLPVLDSSLKKNKLKAYVVNTRGNNYTSSDNIKLETFFIHYISKRKRLTVPLIIIIKNKGSIRAHIATVPGHNAEVKKMNNFQKKKLLNDLNDICKWYKK